jgi:pilus assembly protein CpaC
MTRVHEHAMAWARFIGYGLLAGVWSAAWSGGVNAQASPEQARSLVEPAHRSHLTLPPGGPYPISRKVTIGVDKSMLVEVPIDLTNVLVSNPEVMDAVVQTSRQVYLLAKEVGEANAFFIGPDGQKVLFLEVSVGRDLTTLRDTLQRLLPGSKIAAEMVGENLVLSGSVVDPLDANRAADLAGRFIKKKDGVVNMLTTSAKEQVLLRVKVAEMQRDAIRRLGVNTSTVLQSGHITVSQVLQNSFPVTAAVSGGKATDVIWQNGDDSVAALVQMLERGGLMRTLAEPNLTAMSGEQAKFLAGGEMPVPVGLDDNKVAVEWKPFGVNVSFKPVVMSEGRISLAVSAEVSELSEEGAITLTNGPLGTSLSLPGIKVRRAETTLELPSGGTLAMAGLLSEDTRKSVEGLPGLKEVPVLGALFRSNDYRKRETELVILVTPYLATHAPRAEFATPDDGYLPQSELKELFFGQINRVYGRPERPVRGRYHGDFGFVIEYPDPADRG